MTWLFVRTSPEDVMTIPVPAAELRGKPSDVLMTTTPVPIGAGPERAHETPAAIAAAARAARRKRKNLCGLGILSSVFIARLHVWSMVANAIAPTSAKTGLRRV